MIRLANGENLHGMAVGASDEPTHPIALAFDELRILLSADEVVALMAGLTVASAVAAGVVPHPSTSIGSDASGDDIAAAARANAEELHRRVRGGEPGPVQ